MAQFEQVATADELQPGDRKSVVVDDTPVLLVRTEDGFLEIEDVCTHDGQPLTDGEISGNEIACARHGAKFDLRTGEALCMPATEAVACFQVEVRDGAIFAAPADGSQPPAPAKAEENAAPAESVTADTSIPAPINSTELNEGPMPEDLELIEALKQVIDPELMINIVDLGLVYNVEKRENAVVGVEMTLTSPACPAGPQIIQQSKMALERLRGVSEADIKLTMTPPWTPERMTDDARDQLGIF